MGKTLKDYMTFHMSTQTYGSDLDAGRLAKRIKAEFELEADEADGVDTFAMAYSCTDDITFSFDGKEKKALSDFCKAWSALGKNPSIKQIEALRRALPYAIMSEWITAFHAAQALFDTPDDEKPFDMLTPEQQKEAKLPNSPLPESAA